MLRLQAWERHAPSIKAWSVRPLDAATTHARCFAAATYDRARVPRAASALLSPPTASSDADAASLPMTQPTAQPPVDTPPPAASSTASPTRNGADGTSTLNPAQRQVADWFARRSGGSGGGGGGGGGSVQCVWGPPGTGKSTTIVAAMKATLLSAVGSSAAHAIVAAAPSNQAVQTLAARFRAASPGTLCCLIGVADTVPGSGCPALQDCFLHGWAEHQAARLGALAEALAMADTPLKLAAVCQRLLGAGRTLKGRVPAFYRRVAATWDNFIAGVVELCSQTLATPVDRAARLVACGPLQRIEQTLRTAPTESIEREHLLTAAVVFCTLSTCGRPSLAAKLSAESLIIDEAGQATEAEALVAVTAVNPNHLCLVGDPKQLPATVASRLAERLGHGCSMLDRLLQATGQPQPHLVRHMLTEQFRMHPEIAAFPNAQFYDGKLQSAPQVAAGRRWPATAPPQPYRFVDVRHPERRDGTSYTNAGEVAAVVRALRETMASLGTADIGCITFYAAQQRALKEACRAAGGGLEDVRVASVDGFQGGECDAIVLSCVRSGPGAAGGIGFLRDFRRLNVALTRAKRALVVVGNAETLGRDPTAAVGAMVADARRRGLVTREAEL